MGLLKKLLKPTILPVRVLSVRTDSISFEFYSKEAGKNFITQAKLDVDQEKADEIKLSQTVSVEFLGTTDLNARIGAIFWVDRNNQEWGITFI